MKRLTNARFLAGLLLYVVIVAVTFGFAFGGRYHKDLGESGDAVAAASPTDGSGETNDAVTSATPNGGTIPGGEADALTAASPLTDSPGAYQTPDSTTGASPVSDPSTSPTPPPDGVSAPTPVPTTPDPTPPPDAITEPSPAPGPGTEQPPEPGRDEEDEEDEDERDEAFNLLFLFAPLGTFGMTFFGLSAFSRRRREDD